MGNSKGRFRRKDELEIRDQAALDPLRLVQEEQDFEHDWADENWWREDLADNSRSIMEYNEETNYGNYTWEDYLDDLEHFGF